LGTLNAVVDMYAGSQEQNVSNILGEKYYSASEHRSNVLTVYSDLKIPLSSNGTIVDGYQVAIVNIADYSGFGVELDGRTIKNGNYRRSLQGQEADDEILGEGNFISFKYRNYDPRIGRLGWRVDPLAEKFPDLTPYQYASNSPIEKREIEGLEGTSSKPLMFNLGFKISLQKTVAYSLSASMGYVYSSASGLNLEANLQLTGKLISGENGYLSGNIAGSSMISYGDASGFTGAAMFTHSQTEVSMNDFHPATGLDKNGDQAIGGGVKGELMGSTSRKGPSGAEYSFVGRFSTGQIINQNNTGLLNGTNAFEMDVLNLGVSYEKNITRKTTTFGVNIRQSHSTFTPTSQSLGNNSFQRDITLKSNINITGTTDQKSNSFLEANFSLNLGGSSVSGNMPLVQNANINYSNARGYGLTNTSGVSAGGGTGVSTIQNTENVGP